MNELLLLEPVTCHLNWAALASSVLMDLTRSLIVKLSNGSQTVTSKGLYAK